MKDNEIFVSDFIRHLESKEYVNDRSWEHPAEDADMFWSFRKGPIEVEIHLNWDRTVPYFPPLRVDILKYLSERPSGGEYIGKSNVVDLVKLEKPFSLAFFDQLISYFFDETV